MTETYTNFVIPVTKEERLAKLKADMEKEAKELLKEMEIQWPLITPTDLSLPYFSSDRDTH